MWASRFHFSAVLILVLVSGWPATGRAEPSLSASELLQYCSAWRDEPHSSAGLYCPAYVRGFMDGAASKTRLRAGSEVVAESFLDRARRTRLTASCSQRSRDCRRNVASPADLNQLLENSLNDIGVLLGLALHVWTFEHQLHPERASFLRFECFQRGARARRR